MKLFKLFILLVAFTLSAKAQNVGVGQWEEHLSYTDGVSVAEAGDKVYLASKSGVFLLHKADNSMERLSKVKGLSDVEPIVINYNKYNNKLLIAYKNSNIDIIDNTTITNLADIKRKSILGNKSINNIYYVNQYAYLACGFGIIILDMNKYEIKDTYYIGTNGSAINVRDITSDDTYLYAATDSGVYRAVLTSPNLANYNSWKLMNGISKGIYNAIANVNGKIVSNYSNFLKDGSTNKDTIFVFDSGIWKYMNGSGYKVNSFKTCNNSFLISYDNAVSLYDMDLVLKSSYNEYFGIKAKAKQAILDSENSLWIADGQFGLVLLKSGGSFEYHYPNGPNSANVSEMCVLEDMLWVAPGNAIPFYNDGIYTYSEQEWKHIYSNYPSVVNFDSIYSINHVLIDPNNSTKAYATWGNGLIEFENGVPVKLYNEANSTLKGLGLPDYNPIVAEGIAIDASDNLWVANSGVQNSISQKSQDGKWQALNFSAFVGTAPDLRQILIDQSNQKWIIIYRAGILVYSGTTDAPSTSNTKKMTTAKGEGALPSLNVLSMAEDQDGQIWIGTDKGIAVFYSPSSVFTGQKFDSEQILVEQDGNIQLLLETESVQSIAIDGANRKWIATGKSGVFLMSADGTKQIYHFDEVNSPLLSNDVKNIVINQKTGEVYFGTSKGIISFRGTATGADESYTNVYAFPNPVKPTYEGPIAIKGLMLNSTVKITDISGTLIYETKSEGGQAIWNGKNNVGERVNTGVYMVFCTSADGEKKVATKILFIN